jgi:hypothetical protein
MTTSPTACVVCDLGKHVPARDSWPTTVEHGHQVHKACRHQVESAFRSVEHLVIVDGVARWSTNDQVVPADWARLAVALGILDADVAAASAPVRDAETAAFFAEYRRRQPAAPSAEEQYEMRAAFGEGVEIVNVISGRRWTT